MHSRRRPGSAGVIGGLDSSRSPHSKQNSEASQGLFKKTKHGANHNSGNIRPVHQRAAAGGHGRPGGQWGSRPLERPGIWGWCSRAARREALALRGPSYPAGFLGHPGTKARKGREGSVKPACALSTHWALSWTNKKQMEPQRGAWRFYQWEARLLITALCTQMAPSFLPSFLPLSSF